jgi:murein DD-endopeptidase MepM/ murein hydrolase activator NlpD
MGKSLYRYNKETCHYERIRLKPLDVISYTVGSLLVAVMMLAGMLFLHDFLIDSEKEITLRKENNALEKNHVILTSQLNSIESTLAFLRNEDERLHFKFFGTELEKGAKRKSGIANKNLLLADPKGFRNAAELIDQQSSAMLKQSSGTNSFFGDNLSLPKERAINFGSMPTLQPIQPWNYEKVISGTGMRINPFHKGLYEHYGIDIAVVRGTPVIATGAGRILEAKRSNLQAGYGNYIDVDHGQGFITRYAHLEEINVRAGQQIDKGFIIGSVGSSGGSIAPHLHYEIIRDGKNEDPINYMIEALSSEEHFQMKLLSEKQNQSLD